MDLAVLAGVLGFVAVVLFATGQLMTIRRVGELEKRVALLEQDHSGT